MTWSTCWPQPAQVVLPHFLQVAARHIVVIRPSFGSESRGEMGVNPQGGCESAPPYPPGGLGSATGRVRLAQPVIAPTGAGENPGKTAAVERPNRVRTTSASTLR